jgi:hypothetical protein
MTRSRAGLGRLASVLVLATSVLMAVPAAATAAPAEFGSTWDDPRTAAPPVEVPDSTPCSVPLITQAFRDYDVHTRSYNPTCRGPWSKVVLRMDGSVAGRQFDRLGWLDLGGVRLLTTSTPEPSTTGISWHVEKDLTELAPLFRSPQQVAMYLGNTVDSTYTGVLNVSVRLDFYRPGHGFGVAKTADSVLPLANGQREGTDLTGSLTLPRNTTRLVADVFATGSGGGCEEFWDTSAPGSTGYSCADGLPYREVDVLIDGQLAGVALPSPVIYTGGWSNPFLWYNIPSPNAFDIPPLRYDLTPFAALLNDGAAHDIRIHVQGLPAGQSGWTLAPRFQVWTDADLSVVNGSLVSTSAPAAQLSSTVTGANGNAGGVTLHGSRTFSATGRLVTSDGPVTTTVTRSLTNDSDHDWTDAESQDVLKASWRDLATSSVVTANGRPSVSNQDLRYTKDGVLGFTPHAGIDGAYDVTGDITIGYRQHSTATTFGRPTLDRNAADTYTGRASWIYGVDRDQRHATATTAESFRLTGAPRTDCYARDLVTRNGFFTLDRTGC